MCKNKHKLKDNLANLITFSGVNGNRQQKLTDRIGKPSGPYLAHDPVFAQVCSTPQTSVQSTAQSHTLVGRIK